MLYLKYANLNTYFKLYNNNYNYYSTIVLNKKENYIYTYFKTEFSKSFKYNGNRRPFLNKNVFKNQIKYINKNNITIDDILNLNDKYKTKDYKWFPSKGKINNIELLNLIKKENLLYLGMIPYNWHEHIKEIPDSNSEIRISQSLRQQVWIKHAGKQYEIFCNCCNVNLINCFTFECGHILAHSKGGLCNINNLIPICGLCNKSMSNINLIEFKKNYLLKFKKK